MINDKLTVNEAVKAINERIDDHIGSNGNAHLPVSKDRAGFESPTQLLKNIESAGNRTYLEDGTDIFQLEPGKYWGTKLLNSPAGDDNAAKMIDVTSVATMKQITMLLSYKGSYYKYTAHTNDAGLNVAAPITWTAVERSEILWSGVASSVGTVLKLLDRPSKFSKLRLTIDNSNAQIEVRDFTSRGSITVVAGNIFNSMRGIGQMKMLLDIDSNANTATISNNFSYSVTSGGVGPTNDMIVISKIEGVI